MIKICRFRVKTILLFKKFVHKKMIFVYIKKLYLLKLLKNVYFNVCLLSIGNSNQILGRAFEIACVIYVYFKYFITFCSVE